MAMSKAEKAARKAARQVRDKAFQARRRRYRKLFDAAKASVSKDDVDRSVQAIDAVLEERNRKEQEIRNKIAALEIELASMSESYVSVLARIRQERNEKVDEYQSAVRKATGEVDEAYPDMVDCFYASTWSVPDEVQREMDAAAERARTQAQGEQ